MSQSSELATTTTGAAMTTPAAPCTEGGSVFLSVASTVLLFFLIAGLAGSVDVATFRAQLHRRRGIACGVGCQFLLMPLIGYLVVLVLNPEPHVGLTLMVLCSSSGGAYSNWWCSLFNADLALSVAMTAVSTLLSAVMLPLNLTIYMAALKASLAIPWAGLLQGVGIVFFAIIVGVAICTWFPKWTTWMNRIGNLSGISMIIITLSASFLKQSDPAGADLPGEKATPLWGKKPAFYVVVAMPFFVSLCVSLLVSCLRCLQLTRPERVAIVVEVSYQNIGIASAMALAAFCGDARRRADAAAVPLLYGIFEAVFLAAFCLVMWKCGWTYAPREASFWTVIRGDFQPRMGAASTAALDAPPESCGKGKSVDTESPRLATDLPADDLRALAEPSWVSGAVPPTSPTDPPVPERVDAVEASKSSRGRLLACPWHLVRRQFVTLEGGLR